MNKLVLSCIFVMVCFFGLVFSANSFAGFHTYTGTATGTIVVSGPSVNGTIPFSEPMSFVVGDDRSFVFTIEGASFSTDVKKDGSFSGPVSFDIIDGTCTVTVNVAGTINGKNASGTVSGSDGCVGNSLTLNSTYTTSSPTEPNYEDTSNQFKVAVIPIGDSLLPIVIKPKCPANPVTAEEAICKPMIFNKGWDTHIGNIPTIDPSVNINFQGIVGGAVTYNGPEIAHWGLQKYFNTPKPIYAKAVLMVDKGETVEGGVFEWSRNRQGSVHLINIVRTDHPEVPWLANWTDPRPGDTVWYFIMSDDERFTSRPFSFIWPSTPIH